jgi:predicted  nucleic acid-binding Zn-ribbon protein
MGPTNVALVTLFEADRKLRDVKAKLEAASHNVRIQERRVNDLSEKLRLAQQTHKERQARAAQMDLELKARDAHIEKLRTQQQGAKNNKEYQALLVEINTRKLDRNKIEEQALANLEALEKLKVEGAGLTTGLAGEKAKLEAMKAQSGETLAVLQAEVDAVTPERKAAEAVVPAKARDLFNRLADKYDGEAMAGIDRPDRRKEEYLCTACNMELVRDIYNKLNSRDDVVFCPNCQRMLFIPDHFTAEHAIGGPTKTAAPKKAKVTIVRQRTPAAKKAPKSAAAAAATTGSAAVDASAAASGTVGGADAPADKDVVVIEARATGALGRALAMAQGESVSRAMKSDTNPVECEVYVDQELAGIYKGISVENLERAIKYFMGELKLTYTTLQVKAAGSAPAEPSEQAAEPAAAAAPVAGNSDAATAAAAGTTSAPAATDDAATPAGEHPATGVAEAQTSESIPAPEATTAT